MVRGKLKVDVLAQTNENAKKIGAVLNNIVSTVSEKDLLKIYEIIQNKPDFFKRVVSKLDSPVVKMALGI